MRWGRKIWRAFRQFKTSATLEAEGEVGQRSAMNTIQIDRGESWNSKAINSMRPVELKVASSDASACINCSNSLDLLSIPFSLALQIFIQHEVVVNHFTQRLCAQCNHIQVEDLSIPVRRTSKYNRRAVGLLLLELRLHRKGLHVSSLSEVELKRATRLTLDQLKNLADRLKIGIVSVFTFLLLCSMGIS